MYNREWSYCNESGVNRLNWREWEDMDIETWTCNLWPQGTEEWSLDPVGDTWQDLV